MQICNKYDTVIIGGGLAGLTLALQLKQTNPEVSILLLEKRKNDAPAATHKVGESLSEMASSYLREVLNLKDYLTEHQLPKFGFRFFFSPEHANDISRRVEVGSKISDPYPSHQIDRGLLENKLVEILRDMEVEVVLGVSVTHVELSNTGQFICFKIENNEYTTVGKWIVDATGRNGLLKRKLGLKKDFGHSINSAWFRLDAVIDVDDWSDNLAWRNFVDPGRRRLATNHLMGEGYWVWIIPLVSGKTSIGIVADPVYHPFNDFNTMEKAMMWLEKHEPLAADMLFQHAEKQMDFKVMKQFAYDTTQFYSEDKWAVTGEAGAFMDPLYSPGSDFIALNNSWITELIVRDVDGENTAFRAAIYDLAHKELLNGWITLYRNMYGLFGKTRIMLMKIIWDWASYWAIPNVLFINKGYTDINILKEYSSSNRGIGRRFAKLNVQMQELFQSWGRHETEQFADQQFNVFDLKCLRTLQRGLGVKYERDQLMPKVESNLELLEQIWAEIFRLVSNQINGTAADMRVDPYSMRISEGQDELLIKSAGKNALGVVESIRDDIAKMWPTKIETPQNEFA